MYDPRTCYISYQLDCNPSQVKSNLRLVVSLLLHCLFYLLSFFLLLYIYYLTTLNAYISVYSQPILVKFCILHLRTNLNKLYDTKPNLNHSKSQLISATSNAYISVNSQPILFKLWILHLLTNSNKLNNSTPNLN